MNTLMKFARSRHGRRLAAGAMTYAQTPKGRRQIAQAREQLAKRRRPR
jgi:broad specificity phosphatase PhoE